MWADSRAFLSAICHDAGSGADGENGADPIETRCNVIDFDAPGQPRRRRVGLILTTRKKRGRLNSAGGATSKGNVFDDVGSGDVIHQKARVVGFYAR